MFTFHIALAAYVNSSFIAQNIQAKYVGLLYTVASIITLIIFAKSSYILRYLGNKKFVLTLLSINILSLFGLIFIQNAYILAICFIGFITTNSAVMFSMDIFVEHFTDKKKEASSRGIYLSIINLSWVISPLLTALIVGSDNNYKLLYQISTAIACIMTVILLLSVREFTDTIYNKIPLMKGLSYLKNTGHVRSIVVLNFLLQIFFSIMVVYTPIYLRMNMNFTWEQIGVIFTVMLVPFVIFSALTGRLIERYNFQKRKLISFGFFVMVASVSIIPHLGNNIALWALVLFMTRMGASIVQTTTEVYFFTHVKEEDAYLFGIYRDMDPLAHIVGPLVASLIIIAFPFVYLFFALTLILIVAFYFIPQLKHNHEYTLPITNQ